jgi:hypothetical protein
MTSYCAPFYELELFRTEIDGVLHRQSDLSL